MNSVPDVLILGGGVIGLTTAYYLAKAGATVSVVDRGDLGRAASWAGAGILPPGNLDSADTPLECLRAHSVRLYPELSRELYEQTGIDNGYRVCGGLEVLDPDDPVPSDEWRGEGVTVREVVGAELDAIEPALAPHFE